MRSRECSSVKFITILMYFTLYFLLYLLQSLLGACRGPGRINDGIFSDHSHFTNTVIAWIGCPLFLESRYTAELIPSCQYRSRLRSVSRELRNEILSVAYFYAFCLLFALPIIFVYRDTTAENTASRSVLSCSASLRLTLHKGNIRGRFHRRKRSVRRREQST